MTSLNGSAIAYDAIGNPIVYSVGGANAALTWANGRQLATLKNSSKNIAYTYNDEGIRISKTVGSTKHVYQLNGTQIISESWGSHTILYIYDEMGSIAGMRYRTSSYAAGVFDEYLFEKNLQGDVVAVYNTSGTKLVSYTYDAWGKVTTTYHNSGSSTGARYNPFRYRGYYYDEDTGFYYLNSRYYDPSVGRFISADGYVSTGQGIIGNNMFVYCNNNPIMLCDPCGTCLHRWDFWNDCSRCAGKSFGEKVAVLGEDVAYLVHDIGRELTLLSDAFEFDIGLGVGFGGSIELDKFEITGLARGDIITFGKKAGKNLFIAQADEAYFEIVGAGTSFPIGYKAINYFSGERYEEELKPDWDTSITFGGSLYCIFGVTIKVGFDVDHYIKSKSN